MSTQDAPGPPCRWCEQPTTITDERTIDGQDIIRFVCQPCRQLRDAAPDLLAALKHTQSILHGDVCQQYADCVEACEIAQAAIAKAEEGS